MIPSLVHSGVLSTDYAYPMGILFSSAIVGVAHNFNVGSHRRAAKVEYPTHMVSSQEAASDPNKMRFNCAQRAHYNYLENYPVFLSVFLTASVAHPIASSYLGAIYLAGRVVYMMGYTTGQPAKRQRGAFQYIGLLGLLGYAVHSIYLLGSSSH